MCLTILSRRKPLIARKPIKVYKKVFPATPKGRIQRSQNPDRYSNTARPSIYNDHGFFYTLGKENPKIQMVLERDCFGEFDINEGYHSYVDNDFYRCNAEFEIPVGAEYYINKDKDLRVSSQIIFKRWL